MKIRLLICDKEITTDPLKIEIEFNGWLKNSMSGRCFNLLIKKEFQNQTNDIPHLIF